MSKKAPNEDCSTRRVVELIQENTPSSQKEAWECIGDRCFNKSKGMLKRFGVPTRQIDELLYDAGAELFHNVLSGKFKELSTICTYYYRIIWNFWNKILRDQERKLIGSRNKEKEESDFSLSREIELYLTNKVSEEKKQQFEQRLKNDTDLQEIVESIKEAIAMESELTYHENLVGIEDNLNEVDPQEARLMLLKLFPEGSNCIDLLIDYFFVHDSNYYKLASAHKMKREPTEKAYERVRKQINRCVNKFKQELKNRSDGNG